MTKIFPEIAFKCEEIFNRLEQDKIRKRIERNRRKRLLQRKLRGRLSAELTREPREREEVPTEDKAYIKELKKVLAAVDFNHWQWNTYMSIDRAWLHLLYVRQEYNLLRQGIEIICDCLPRRLEREVELLWNNATYRSVGEKKYESMSPVDTYRLRRKYPCPTVTKCGGIKYGIREIDRQALEREYQRTNKPNRFIKEQLAKETGYSYHTISNFFKNRRQRDKRNNIKEVIHINPFPLLDEYITPAGSYDWIDHLLPEWTRAESWHKNCNSDYARVGRTRPDIAYENSQDWLEVAW